MHGIRGTNPLPAPVVGIAPATGLPVPSSRVINTTRHPMSGVLNRGLTVKDVFELGADRRHGDAMRDVEFDKCVFEDRFNLYLDAILVDCEVRQGVTFTEDATIVRGKYDTITHSGGGISLHDVRADWVSLSTSRKPGENMISGGVVQVLSIAATNRIMVAADILGTVMFGNSSHGPYCGTADSVIEIRNDGAVVSGIEKFEGTVIAPEETTIFAKEGEQVFDGAMNKRVLLVTRARDGSGGPWLDARNEAAWEMFVAMSGTHDDDQALAIALAVHANP